MKPLATWFIEHDPLWVARTPALAPGHDPCSMYVETFWLPVVGPTTTMLLRRLGVWLMSEPAGFSIDLAELSKTIGLGSYDGGTSTSIVRALTRMAQFDLARVSGNEFQVIMPVSGLLGRQVRRLPPRLRSAHEFRRVTA